MIKHTIAKLCILTFALIAIGYLAYGWVLLRALLGGKAYENQKELGDE